MPARVASGPGSGSRDPPKDPAADQTSIYYVHPRDGLSSVSVTPVLNANGINYHTWARPMRRALGGKNKYGFVVEP